MRKWWLLFVLASLTASLVGIFVFKNKQDYYPRESFKIPADVLKERIATLSAQTVRVPIVMYHYIEYVDKEKDPGRANLATSPYVLDRQIASLKKGGYTFLFSKEVSEIIKQKNLLLSPIVLTFDDGYEDFYWNAMPILKKYQVKATIYVISGWIGRSGYLNLKQLEEIRDSGLVEIAAHTLNHAVLKNLKYEVAKKEIFESKTKLEKLLGITIYSFAYPYGAFLQETLNLTKAAGFTNAVSVIPGVNQSEDNLFYLYRIRPGFLGLQDSAKSLKLYK